MIDNADWDMSEDGKNKRAHDKNKRASVNERADCRDYNATAVKGIHHRFSYKWTDRH